MISVVDDLVSCVGGAAAAAVIEVVVIEVVVIEVVVEEEEVEDEVVAEEVFNNWSRYLEKTTT